MVEKAFMSYSHAADGKLAPQFQAALQRFAKPWYQLRAIRIFRDKTSLSVNPALWSSICKILDNADYFLLLASPDAASSPWVRKEVDYWLQKNGADRLLIVLTDGDVSWSDENGDFDWERTDALPDSLAGVYPEEPLYLDLRWARKETDLSLNHPQFREAVSELAAALRGIEKDELIGADIRFHKRAIRLAWSAASVLLILALATSGAAIYAYRQRAEALNQRNRAFEERNRAEEQSKIATARGLAAQSQLLFARRPDFLEQSVLLAIESYRRFPSYEAVQSLVSALPLMPRQTARFTHEGEVWSANFSANGKLLVTGSADGTVGVWDLAQKKRLAKLVHEDRIMAVALSDDGRCLAAAGFKGVGAVWCAANDPSGSSASNWQRISTITYDSGPKNVLFTADNNFVAVQGDKISHEDHTSHGVQVFDVNTGRTLIQLASKAGANDMARNPSRTQLAVAGKDSRVYIWDAQKSKPVRTLDHDGAVLTVQYQTSGEHLISVTEKGSVYTWRTDSWKTTAKSRLITAAKYAAVSSDARSIATSTYGDTVDIWQAETGESLFTIKLPGESIQSMVFSPDSQYLAVWGDLAKYIQIWNVSKKKEVARITQKGILHAAFSPDGSMFVSAGGDGSARIWEHAATLASFEDLYETGVQQVRFSSGGNYLVAGTTGGQLQLTNLSNNKYRSIQLSSGVERLVFSHNEKLLAVGTMEGRVLVWETDTGTMFGQFSLDCKEYGKTVNANSINCMDWSKNGRYLAAACVAGVALIWDTQDKKTVASMQDVWHLSFHPNGQLLATCGRDGNARIWQCGSWHELSRLKQDGALMSGVFSKTGRYFAVASDNGRVFLWRTSNWERVAVFDHGDWCHTAHFSEDEKRMASAGDGIAKVWDISSRKLVAQMKPNVNIHDLRFGPEGKFLLIASNEHDVTIWDVVKNRPELSLPHEDAVITIDFSPGFEYLVTGSADRSVRAWYWRAKDWLSEGCNRLARNLTPQEWKQFIGNEDYRKTCPDIPAEGGIN